MEKRVGTINDHQHFNISTQNNTWLNKHTLIHTNTHISDHSKPMQCISLKSKDEDEKKKNPKIEN